MPSSPVVRASDGHARIFPTPAARPGGGTGSGGRGLPHRRYACPEPEIQRSPAPHMSPPSPPPHSTSAAAADTPGRGVMDAICSLAATQAAQDQRLALGVPRDPDQREEPTTGAASLDVLAAAAAAIDPPPPQQ